MLNTESSRLSRLVDVDEREEFNDSHFWRIPEVDLPDDISDEAVGAPLLGLEQRFGKPATTAAVGGALLFLCSFLVSTSVFEF